MVLQLVSVSFDITGQSVDGTFYSGLKISGVNTMSAFVNSSVRSLCELYGYLVILQLAPAVGPGDCA